MPFKSKAQQRFAFGTGQPWARKWADETRSFKRLPEKVKSCEFRKDCGKSKKGKRR